MLGQNYSEVWYGNFVTIHRVVVVGPSVAFADEMADQLVAE